MIRPGLWVFLEEDPGGRCPSHHIVIKGTYYQLELSRSMLTGSGGVCQVSPLSRYFPHFPYCTLQNDVTVQSSQLRVKHLHEFFGIFLQRDLSIVPHLFIHSIIYLYQYGCMDTSFILSIQYYVIYFSTQIVPALATGNSFS